MKIAFYNIIGNHKNAERETLLRMQNVFQKQGHEFLELNRDGYVISDSPDKGKFVEHIKVDVMFTCDPVEFALIPLPDVFSVFAHWAPIGFFENFKARAIMESLHLYDAFACTYERDLIERVVQIPAESISFFGSSVPADYARIPRRQCNRKLFYAGINFERSLYKMRYGELLKELDKSGYLEIYGPKKVYGRANLWAGFKSYCGEIPFDGCTILDKINQAGVCLAINSPMHNDAGGVSNRTYEAAAAGAVIISDDNPFVHKYFGDSVFYIENDLSEREASEKIMRILKWVNLHQEEAYQKAVKSQRIFLKQFTLDQMIQNFTDSVRFRIDQVHDENQQEDMIDVICFIDEANDYFLIETQLKKQYYQNLHLILITDKDVYESIQISWRHDFVHRSHNQKGYDFSQSIRHLKGKYFMFIDKYVVLHSRHIYKNREVLAYGEGLFAYSGCYLKNVKCIERKYIVLNNKPISQDEFLLFSNELKEIESREIALYIETIFSRSAALFQRNILNHTDERELILVSDNVHMYLACCSLIKAGQRGHFTYALTTGYRGKTILEMEKKVFWHRRRFWYTGKRIEQTYIDELRNIFPQYCH